MPRHCAFLFLCIVISTQAFAPGAFTPNFAKAGLLAHSKSSCLLSSSALMRPRPHFPPITRLFGSQIREPSAETEKDMKEAVQGSWFSMWSDSRQREKFIASATAFAAVAGTGILSFVVEQGGTFIILEALRRYTKTGTLVQMFDVLAAQADTMGLVAMPIYAIGATMLQLAPVCNSILMSMAVGVIFGTTKGIAIMSFAATLSSVICLLNSRYLAASALRGASSKTPPIFQAISNGISDSQKKTLFLVGLVRLSPVIPFVWSNYLFGLTPVAILPYAAGTFIGTLPGVSVFVSAGVVGKAVAAGGVAVPPALIITGVGATIAVLVILGKVSQKELSKYTESPPSDLKSGV